MDVTIPILGWCCVILLTEGILWILFSRRFAQICLPEADRTIFHLFTLIRMRILVALHTVLLLVTVIVSHLLLWQ